MSTKPPLTIGAALRGLWRIRGYYLRWLGVNAAVGFATLILLLAVCWLAELLRSVPLLQWLVLCAGPLGVAAGYHFFARRFLHQTNLSLSLIQGRLHTPDELPQGTIPISYGAELAQKMVLDEQSFSKLQRQVRSALRSAHRHLIDVLAFIRWLRRLKVAALITEMSHGVVVYISLAIEGNVFAGGEQDALPRARDGILRYLVHWKTLLKPAMRYWLIGAVLWAVFALAFLASGYALIRISTHWLAQLISAAGIVLLVRFLIVGVYHPIAQTAMLDLLMQLDDGEPERNQRWKDRLGKVSREFQELERRADSLSEESPTEKPSTGESSGLAVEDAPSAID